MQSSHLSHQYSYVAREWEGNNKYAKCARCGWLRGKFEHRKSVYLQSRKPQEAGIEARHSRRRQRCFSTQFVWCWWWIPFTQISLNMLMVDIQHTTYGRKFSINALRCEHWAFVIKGGCGEREKCGNSFGRHCEEKFIFFSRKALMR